MKTSHVLRPALVLAVCWALGAGARAQSIWGGCTELVCGGIVLTCSTTITVDKDHSPAGEARVFQLDAVPPAGAGTGAAPSLVIYDTARGTVDVLPNVVFSETRTETARPQDEAGNSYHLGMAWIEGTQVQGVVQAIQPLLKDRAKRVAEVSRIWKGIFRTEQQIDKDKEFMRRNENRVLGKLTATLTPMQGQEAKAYAEMNTPANPAVDVGVSQRSAILRIQGVQERIANQIQNADRRLASIHSLARALVEGSIASIMRDLARIQTQLDNIEGIDDALHAQLLGAACHARRKVPVVNLRRLFQEAACSPSTAGGSATVTALGYFAGTASQATLGSLGGAASVTNSSPFLLSMNFPLPVGAASGNQTLVVTVGQAQLTKSNALTVFDLAMANPAGDPSLAPVDNQNEFWFQFRRRGDPGALYMLCRATTSPDTGRTRYHCQQAHVRWSFNIFPDDLQWSQSWGGASDQGDGLFVTARVTGMPSLFGPKTVRVEGVEGTTSVRPSETTVEVFYSRDADNNPFSPQVYSGDAFVERVLDGIKKRNWFAFYDVHDVVSGLSDFYYNDDYGVLGLTWSTVLPTQPRSLGNLAPTSAGPLTLTDPVLGTISVGPPNNIKGIDTVASVMVHETQHVVTFNTESPKIAAWRAAGSPPGYPASDDDGDGVTKATEKLNGTNPDNPDTYNIASIHPDRFKEQIKKTGDEELIAWRSEQQNPVPGFAAIPIPVVTAANDWGHPGRNKGKPVW